MKGLPSPIAFGTAAALPHNFLAILEDSLAIKAMRMYNERWHHES